MAETVILECTTRKELKRKEGGYTAMMGKSHKFPRGHSSAFVPEYRHAAETVAESEGFGCSGRADSEGSCTPKRKCISLNVDRCSGLNVPLQVISLSKISSLAKKELAVRLRSELEQIQAFQKRLNSRAVTSASGVAVSSSSNGHGRKRDPMGQNGAQSKHGVSGRLESVKPAQPPPVSVSNSDALLLKQCEQVLKRLWSHQYAWVFKTPVDVVKLNIPDYHTVIKHPMDLGTIKTKLASGSYSSPQGFAADVRLTFTNAMTYNPPGNDVHIMADVMMKFFEARWKPIEKKLAATDTHAKRETEPAKKAPQPTLQSAQQPVPQMKKRKVPPVNHNVVMPERIKPKMTVEEKQTLSRRLESLIVDLPDHIVDYLRRHGENASQAVEDEIEIDIDSLSDDTLFELRRLLDDYLREKQTGQEAKDERCEIEVLNVSGLSNLSMHPSKVLHTGNEPPDEDVDIGGNDPPISSYPPVEIDKDAGLRSSKCSSSGSSSSDSGSSSSDSDSGSSSGSDSAGRVASPAKAAKANAEREATTMGQEKSDVMNPIDINIGRTGNVSGLDQLEHDGHEKLASVETDCHHEEENAPSERKVSPEKLYRAALLRSRFADTILKAREKTLDQSEKGDPEKLQREKEELERRQREEKARLQAEAKAAEEARRRAEEEAAAEAKRRLELEREAARQALLKMEKTVEINENSVILKDLEMFQSVPIDHVPSSVDETSPDQSHDGIGGFKLGRTNPLEQLGLYMKVDDEEDEYAEPSSSQADVEDGEIDR